MTAARQELSTRPRRSLDGIGEDLLRCGSMVRQDHNIQIHDDAPGLAR